MWNPFKREKIEQKEAPSPADVRAAVVFGMMQEGAAAGPLSTYDAQLRKGLAENPYIYKAVDVRAHAVAILDPIIKNRAGEIIEDQNHPLAQLLRKPNPSQSWSELVYQLQAHYALNGNAFIWLEKKAGTVKALRAVPPSAVSAISANDIFNPVRVWNINTGSGTITVAPSEMIHIYTIRGSDGILGVSPLQAAAQSILAQTSARRWNVALMDNSACPSMAITSEDYMTDEQHERLSRTMENQYTGPRNAGKTLVLDKGLHVESMGSFSAKDLDYTQGIILTAREIAIAEDVPPELIGDSTNKTYNSMAESIRQFANTVCSLADKMYNALTRALADGYADVGQITYDRQQVDGLNDRPSMPDITAADWLTINEKRELLSYPPVEGGDTVLTAMGQVPLTEVTADINDLIQDDAGAE